MGASGVLPLSESACSVHLKPRLPPAQPRKNVLPGKKEGKVGKGRGGKEGASPPPTPPLLRVVSPILPRMGVRQRGSLWGSSGGKSRSKGRGQGQPRPSPTGTGQPAWQAVRRGLVWAGVALGALWELPPASSWGRGHLPALPPPGKTGAWETGNMGSPRQGVAPRPSIMSHHGEVKPSPVVPARTSPKGRQPGSRFSSMPDTIYIPYSCPGSQPRLSFPLQQSCLSLPGECLGGVLPAFWGSPDPLGTRRRREVSWQVWAGLFLPASRLCLAELPQPGLGNWAWLQPRPHPRELWKTQSSLLLLGTPVWHSLADGRLAGREFSPPAGPPA